MSGGRRRGAERSCRRWWLRYGFVTSIRQTLNNTPTVIADLPFGRPDVRSKRARLAAGSAWGWQLSAINVYSSGLPINLTYAPNAQYAVSSTSAGYSVRPNLVVQLALRLNY